MGHFSSLDGVYPQPKSLPEIKLQSNELISKQSNIEIVAWLLVVEEQMGQKELLNGQFGLKKSTRKIYVGAKALAARGSP